MAKEIKPWEAGIPDNVILKCPYCGRIPEIDYVISNKIWLRLVPKKYQLGIICLSCLVRLALNHIDILDDLIDIYVPLDNHTLRLAITDIYESPFRKDMT